MLKVLDFPDKIIETNIKKFPFVYLEGYRSLLNTIEKKKTFFFIDESENTMVCKEWKNKFLKFLQPMYPPLDINGNRLKRSQEDIFLKDFIKFLKDKTRTHRITQPENFCLFQTTPKNSIHSPFGTYFLDLQKKTEDELFKNLHSKHRNVIRNAEKHNVSIKYGKEVIDDFYSLYKQTMQRSNMHCQSLNYFKEFYNFLPKNTICGVAYYNEKPQGALFMPFTEFGAFYLYGASSEKTEINGSMTYLHWNTIKILKQTGIKRYDFVGARLSDVSGTKLEGIQQFKERFGSTLEKGLIWKEDIDKIKCGIFDNLISFKLRLKNQKVPSDIIDQERKKING